MTEERFKVGDDNGCIVTVDMENSELVINERKYLNRQDELIKLLQKELSEFKPLQLKHYLRTDDIRHCKLNSDEINYLIKR